MFTLIIIWACLATAWAIAATFFFFHNPLPFPDRGHRVFGVKDEATRSVVVKVLESASGKKSRFTFDSGDVHQTILNDGYTSIHYIDNKPERIAPCGISLAVENPLAAAQETIRLLKSEGFQAEIIEDVKMDLPPNYLVPVCSDAFDGWSLVFRRTLLKMPKPKFRS